ncbi:hypothetical protein [Pelagerythrobacter sp.]|uniref:hypothetical protein n=1 Tax=Pelagerythrobacter sp. TaxID=2800702 RepID=UPI0035AE5BD7
MLFHAVNPSVGRGKMRASLGVGYGNPPAAPQRPQAAKLWMPRGAGRDMDHMLHCPETKKSPGRERRAGGMFPGAMRWCGMAADWQIGAM